MFLLNHQQINLFFFSFSFSSKFSSFRNETVIGENIWAGILALIFFFMIISVLTFPNGPFTRPHPAVWRMLFGLSVLYLMFLVFLMFQNHKTIMQIFKWFDPSLEDFHINMDKVSFHFSLFR